MTGKKSRRNFILMAGIAAVAVAVGWFGLGGWTLVVGAMCDSLDGAVARERGLASDAGEVLDASVDRWGEMAVFFGFAYYYRNDPVGFILAAAACAVKTLSSQLHARGPILRSCQNAVSTP